MSHKIERFAHQEREARSGRYAATTPCDACGKPVGTNYYTDGEVCGNGDGPGFYLCERLRCIARRTDLDVEQRRALYTRMRGR